MAALEVKTLKDLLTYSPSTGIFECIKKVSGSKYEIGDTVGTVNSDGYLQVSIGGKSYKLHRLAFLYIHGVMPEYVDHMNHDRENNMWSNLRATTSAGNSKNMSMSKGNTSGTTGVSQRSNGKWRAYITVDYKKLYLGTFINKENAVKARQDAEVLHNYHENHGKVA